jgi:hypothetical protein
LVFVEFVARNIPQPGALHYFVGPSLDAVLADTNGGKRFSILHFDSHRKITAREARRLKLQPIEEAIAAIRKRGYRSHKLRASRK